MFARSPFLSGFYAPIALLVAALFGTAAIAAASLPDFHAEAGTHDDGAPRCSARIVRTAAGGTYVIVRDASDLGGCSCTMLTGVAGKQDPALERRIAAWQRDPSCNDRLGLANILANGQPGFAPGAVYGGGQGNFGMLTPSLLGLALGADNARRKNRPDSPGG